MIEVTEGAKEIFQQIDQSTEVPEGQVLRLQALEPDRIGIAVGSAEPDDQVVEQDGKDLVHIAAAISQAGDGTRLDKVDTPEGTALVFLPPEGQEEPAQA